MRKIAVSGGAESLEQVYQFVECCNRRLAAALIVGITVFTAIVLIGYSFFR